MGTLTRAACLATILIGLAGRASSDIVGITWKGEAVSVNVESGLGTLLGPTGVASPNSMALGPEGKYYTVGGTPTRIWVIDPVLGTSTPGHPTFVNDIRSLAWSPSGVLYATAATPGNRSDLYTFDLSVPLGSSAISTRVGEVQFKGTPCGIQAMAIRDNGKIFAWCFQRGLVRIKPSTANATKVNSQSSRGPSIQSMAFRPDGVLFAGRKELYTVDTSTGALTLWSNPNGFDMRGFEFTSDAPVTYCAAKQSSEGCLPVIAGVGTASSSGASTLQISCSEMLDHQNGLLVYGVQGPASTPFQGGTLCVGGTHSRTAAQNSGSAGTSDCSGTLALDFGAVIASGIDPSLSAGQRVWSQWWTRDPGFVAPQNLSLSGALTFVILP